MSGIARDIDEALDELGVLEPRDVISIRVSLADARAEPMPPFLMRTDVHTCILDTKDIKAGGRELEWKLAEMLKDFALEMARAVKEWPLRPNEAAKQ